LQDTPNGFCPEGVGARLVGDLARSGSKISYRDASGTLHTQVLLPLRGRSPTSRAPTPSGQKRDCGVFELLILAEGRGCRLAGECTVIHPQAERPFAFASYPAITR
jgi:hypothetical protein